MKNFQQEIATQVGISPKQVIRVLELFALEMHRSFYELREDPYAALLRKASSMAFFHLMGALEKSVDTCGGELHATEYLLRLGQRSDWQLYSDQMKEWKTQEERG